MTSATTVPVLSELFAGFAAGATAVVTGAPVGSVGPGTSNGTLPVVAGWPVVGVAVDAVARVVVAVIAAVVRGLDVVAGGDVVGSAVAGGDVVGASVVGAAVDDAQTGGQTCSGAALAGPGPSEPMTRAVRRNPAAAAASARPPVALSVTNAHRPRGAEGRIVVAACIRSDAAGTSRSYAPRWSGGAAAHHPWGSSHRGPWPPAARRCGSRPWR
jgi:hypothetical protein